MSKDPATKPDPKLRLPKWVDSSAQSLLDAAPDAVLVVNRAGDIVVANAQAERLFGYGRDELIERSVDSLVPPSLRARHSQFREDVFGNPAARPMGMGFEMFALRKDGMEVPVDINLSTLTNEAGTFVVSAIRDATDRRRTERMKILDAVLRETRESEERFDQIADTAPALIWMSGIDRLCTYFNKSCENFTGRSMEEGLGSSWWAAGIHPEDLQRCLDTYTQSFDRQEKFRMEYRLRRRDGEYRWVLDIGVPRFDRDRSFVGYIAIGVDVTKYKRAEEALHESDDKLHLLLDSTSEAIYGIDQEHCCTFCNPACLRALGYEHMDEVLGKNMHDLIHHSRADGTLFPVEECRVHQVTRTGEGVHAKDEVFWRANGTSFPAEYWSYPQRRGQQLIGAVVTFLDITERKLAEAALANVSRKLIEVQEQERTRIGRELHDDIGERLGMLAIELEQIPRNSSDLPAEVAVRIGELWKQTCQIAADIQSLSHGLHPAKLQYLGIAAAMRGFCKEFGMQQKVEIEFQTHDLPNPVPPDVALCFFRVLQEALHNAAKHSGVRHFEVRLWGMSDEIHLTVKDSGVGFDRQAATESRGLGLISMEERLRLVGGELSIDSKPKPGTTIYARVPLSSGSDSMCAAG